MESVLRYTEDVDVVFTKNNSPLSTLERGQLMRVLCDSSSHYKQKLVKPKPLASKMAAWLDFWLSIYSVIWARYPYFDFFSHVIVRFELVSVQSTILTRVFFFFFHQANAGVTNVLSLERCASVLRDLGHRSHTKRNQVNNSVLLRNNLCDPYGRRYTTL